MTDFGRVFGELPERAEERRDAGAGLALSGGGFRAMLFHVGAVRRLHEIGALRHLARISSVSGGSITAARLALNWDELRRPDSGTADYEELVQQPLFEFASSKLDITTGVRGLLRPKRSIAQTLAKTYDGFLDHATLQDLPDWPRFVFCATNMGSGSLVRFSKPYTADYRIGKRDDLDLPLGTVVAASAAFPPFLSPMVINLSDDDALTQAFAPGDDLPPLANTAPFTHRLELSDGGVYDNLGLQPVDKYHTLLVSDGGGTFGYDRSVAVNWLGHMIRSWNVADNQVRSLRRKTLIAEYLAGGRNGTFWGIRTTYADYPNTAIPVHPGWADILKSISTRLWPMPEERRKQLINWGYCLTDAAIRSHVDDAIEPAPSLPYPETPLHGPPPEKKRPWWKPWGDA